MCRKISVLPFLRLMNSTNGSWTKFNRLIKLVQNHHTYIPGYRHFIGNNHFDLLKGMERSHIERGFSEIGQNLTTFPDGSVAICRSLEKIPAGIKGANTSGICVEHLGNFDAGGDHMTDTHRETIISVNALLCREFNLIPGADTVVYHHWYDLNTGERTDGTGTIKSCPGSDFFGNNTVEAAMTDLTPLVNQAVSKLTPRPVVPQPMLIGTAEVTAAKLNVRNIPEAGGKIVKALRQGIMINAYEERNGWYRVHQMEQHWVFGRYLKFNK